MPWPDNIVMEVGKKGVPASKRIKNRVVPTSYVQTSVATDTGKLDGVEVYADDIAVFWKTPEEHVHRLEPVLRRIKMQV
ncbi:unnamed protein product [Echinostoma caproni]|uniref:Reverse transcriptase domain-containing protein n=1 Tax=Echinostoma caproni TaxID=27848 RepID=A0A183AJ72_9TREM|nr:unnamed protein product [Echinostoma caproni]